MDTASDPDLEALLAYLTHQRGFDFRGYKRPSLTRRLRVRMNSIGVETFREYQDRLEADPQEFSHLFNTILINVTGFFRDPPAWEALGKTILPPLLAAKREEPLRVWSVGCATGEEAYSVVMLLAEALGVEGCRERLKVYATDIDEEALLKGRLAAYTAREVSGVPPELLARYFTTENRHYVFHKELRRVVVFGRHNIVQDVPIAHIDLLVCRNTLMYLNGDTQVEILARFHRALNEHGYLFLGKAETLLSHTGSFTPVDLKHCFFRKGPEPVARDRRPPPAPAGSEAAVNPPTLQSALRDSTFEAGPFPQVVIDRDGRLALGNERARQLFSLEPADQGRLLQDLELSYRPVELRAGIEQAYATGSEVRLPPTEWLASPMGAVALAVRITPLHQADTLVGVSITFEDISLSQQMEQQLKQSLEAQQTAAEELQASHEELETTNEELQSTVEELETTNEELQSANEEMETMNEELQSGNEELQTVNAQLRQRSDELAHANRFLAAILNRLKGGMAVLDRDLRVLVWSRPAEELWGVREAEARDRHFLNLDIGLPVAQLVEPLHASLRGEEREVTLEATNRRGRAIQCRVTCLPLDLDNSEIEGAILVMEPAPR